MEENLVDENTPEDWKIPVAEDYLKDEDRMLTEALKSIKTNIEHNNNVLEMAADTAQSTGDAEHIESYAEVSKSNVELVKLLTNTMFRQQELRQKRELKLKELEVKKQIALMAGKNNKPKELGNGGTTNIQNNFLFRATPDTVFDLINAPADKQKEKLAELMDKEVNGTIIET